MKENIKGYSLSSRKIILGRSSEMKEKTKRKRGKNIGNPNEYQLHTISIMMSYEI